MEESDSRRVAVNQLVAGSAVILAIGTILLVLRLYAAGRLRDARRGLDDFLLMPSLLFLVGLAILNLVYVFKGGAGRPLTDITSSETYTRVRLLYALYWIYPIANTLPRISVIILYLRVFNDKPSKFFSWLVLAFITAHSISTIIVNNVQCIPLKWVFAHESKTPPRCIDLVLWWRDSNFPTIVADVAILLLPVRTVWGLKTSTSKKVGIGVVCLTGSVGLVASCLRTSQLYQVGNYESSRPNLNYYILFFWTTVECGTYHCAACLIGLRPILGQLSHWIYSMKSSTTSKGRHGGTFGSVRSVNEHIDMTRLTHPKESSEDSESTTCAPIPGNDVNIQGSAYHSTSRGTENDSEHRPQIHVETQVRVDVEPDRAAYMV